MEPASLDSTAYLARPEEFAAVAAWIGDSPETTIAVHHLCRRQCLVAISGTLTKPRTVVVQSHDGPEEPTAFGFEASAVWQALRLLSGWTCVNVAPAIATDLASLMQQEIATPIRALDDIYHTMERPAPSIVHEQVQVLTSNDLPLLAAAPRSLQGGGFGGPAAELAEGIVAGGLVGGELVAIAHVYAFAPTYADIRVATREDQRRRGLATAAAALVAERVQAQGRVPVWSCGGVDIASLRGAAKLGFREVSRRVYLLPT